MNPDPDNDLRTRFQAQRRANYESAPAFNLPAARAPSHKVSGSSIKRMWIPVCAAVLLAVGLFFSLPPTHSAPRLADALPVLLDAPSQPLFASLEQGSTSAPSDFLLPAHLIIQMP
ncbi:hypothetical protein EI77_03267 [Prosthecobacter fusiformis]|uniref:Uncharacterized protein n=1 Tax=Prosthecobacter fusiformis TaxID=48464 RepID=A0A4R7RRJ9_9BACT|nr:hypothetical protein [Prosthecobacter fusiformis]TDU68150.1 hypothetical protein EI77_03267 [Prosthecobacter fusiformis]